MGLDSYFRSVKPFFVRTDWTNKAGTADAASQIH
jgi:hypothetical protein